MSRRCEGQFASLVSPGHVKLLVGELLARLTGEGVTVQMVKIQIADREASARAFAALIRRGRVDSYRDNIYIVPEPGLKLLGRMGISFVELGRGGLDYAEKALRDSAAAQVQ